MDCRALKIIITTIVSVLILSATAVKENDPEILVAATTAIYRMNIDGSNKSLVASAINARSLDYHHSKRLLFWSDIATHKIYSKDLFDNSSEIKTVVAGADNWEPRAIAVDFINDKIWVMDQGGLKIDVFELDGSKKVLGLVRNLTDPKPGKAGEAQRSSNMDILVDPYEGLVFYGEYNRVMRATMDFSSIKYVDYKTYESALTVDRDKKYVYVTDANGYMWEVSYEGKHKHIDLVNVYEGESERLRIIPSYLTGKSLSKYNGEYFWLNVKDNEFAGINKYSNYHPHKVDSNMRNAWTIRVRHPSLQDTSLNKMSVDGCKNNKCEYVCLVSNPVYSNVTHSCFNAKGERVVE